ncbi:MAG: VOC family protein [Alphaproteobacteria bacterium]|nr:VOC family protein [Alphaproteobacteria bacterium]
MIDHVSIAVRDLAAGTRFYEPVLATLGYAKLIVRATTVGFGKKYPDFWLNERRSMRAADADSGVHVCLRAPDAAAVDAFHAAALAASGASDGPPGQRPEYTPGYYAAFVRDPDGNRIEAVTFLSGGR